MINVERFLFLLNALSASQHFIAVENIKVYIGRIIRKFVTSQLRKSVLEFSKEM